MPVTPALEAFLRYLAGSVLVAILARALLDGGVPAIAAVVPAFPLSILHLFAPACLPSLPTDLQSAPAPATPPTLAAYYQLLGKSVYPTSKLPRPSTAVKSTPHSA